MSRLGDIFYFLRQIFFPNWIDREDNTEPTRLQKLFTSVFAFLISRNGTGTLFSVILHAFILIILSLIMISRQGHFTGFDTLGGFKVPGVDAAPVALPPAEDRSNNTNTLLQEIEVTEPETPTPETDTQPTTAVEADPSINVFVEQRLQLPTVGGFVSGGGFTDRTPAGRQRAMQRGDSSQRGEAAVDAALEWFVAHQQENSGWSLHFTDSCGRCSHSSTDERNRHRTAATSLALLSFLGAGYTHQTESPYRSVVDSGLNFLAKDPNDGFNGFALRQERLSQMYSRGLAAMALCEAYAMNGVQDPKSLLGIAAQKSLWNIETAQDWEYGGWNYRPDQRTDVLRRIRPGDTSIFSWQLMALKSGKIGGLNVSQSALYRAQDFLDSVALEGGRRYQYLPTGRWDSRGEGDSPQTCTAMGLLMRMYLGWKPGDPFLDDGIEQLAHWGPILHEGEVNLYYIYYATLALHHYGGEHWDAWNQEVQALLIRTQSRQQNCESGSWYFPDRYCDVGGRLLNTALAVMILETPYRFMPLYREIR